MGTTRHRSTNHDIFLAAPTCQDMLEPSQQKHEQRGIVRMCEYCQTLSQLRTNLENMLGTPEALHRRPRPV
ncbi:hypothetical protein D3C80_2131380 [compost metagenome]